MTTFSGYYNTAALEKELIFFTSKSGGKGGQHVNKTESRVELKWNFLESEVITEEQKLILSQLKSVHILQERVIHFASDTSRSQHLNKEAVIKRLHLFLQKVLTPRKKRKPTKVSRTVKEKRKESKQRQSDKKALRRKID